ncbi:hypothetical protein ACIOHE_39210 [Streptomyces sp. NPDC087851]|uniref:hypothetical protein n=1 Tax=Streptomyces sp. NPDC087851 TaxID=3365810 RepID=UPI0038101DCE
MADRKDEIMEGLALGISTVYRVLLDVCGALPVPIGLPVDRNIPVGNAVPAIERVAEIAEDQPMGDLQTTQLYSGCIHLLVAIDLYALCAARYTNARAEGSSVNLLHARAELDPLYVWLISRTD